MIIMKSLKIVAIGDIMLSNERKSKVFKDVEMLLNNKDLLIGNLETVLSKRKTKVRKAHIISAHPESIFNLLKPKFDVVNIANNHSLDLGVEGFKDTIS